MKTSNAPRRSGARVYYLGMIATDSYAEHIGENAYSGAASRKMVTVSRAMKTANLNAVVVSLPSIERSAHRNVFAPVVIKEFKIPLVFLKTYRSRYMRKILGPIYIASFFFSKSRKRDTVILYNYAIEYIPALLIMKLKRLNIVLDIEDAPNKNDDFFTRVLGRVMFALFMAVTNRKKIVVAENVAKRLGIKEYTVVRGVADIRDSNFNRPGGDNKWRQVKHAGVFRLHYGGTLIEETGLELFIETVRKLVEARQRLKLRLELIVTGVGEIERLSSLSPALVNIPEVKLHVHKGVSADEYSKLLKSCHASLSLKKPNSILSETTFPSKVIEITSQGLALISAENKDVRQIFDSSSAYFLSRYTPGALAELIIEMTSDLQRVKHKAVTGQQQCLDSFSLENVGKSIASSL